MHLSCPDCRAPIYADNVDLVKTIAKCTSCHNIFEFEEEFNSKKELPGRYRKEVTIPPGIEVLHLMNELEIMIQWRKSAKNFTLSFALFWNTFVGLAITALLLSGEFAILLFFIPFILAGVYLLYASIGHLVNTSFITVDDKRLSVEHKPINFLIQKDKHFAPHEIKQAYVRKYSIGSTNGNPVYAYAVDLLLKNGKKVPLVKELHALEYAQYIEQEIEHYLKIKDRPVDGEYFIE